LPSIVECGNFKAINSEYPEELTPENVLDRLQFLAAAQFDFQSEINFISAHFDTFKDSHFSGLDLTEL
jgi:hypothetical protein